MELSRSKTLVILAVVVGCFAILWPKIFYPMLQTSVTPHQQQQQTPVIRDRPSGGLKNKKLLCCGLVFESDASSAAFLTELCSLVLRRRDEQLSAELLTSDGLHPTEKALQLCRSELLDKCAIDLEDVVKSDVDGAVVDHRLSSKFRGRVRTQNLTQCLQHNFDIDENLVRAKKSYHRPSDVYYPRHMRPERPPHLHPEGMHPALREKGRVIPPIRTIEKEAKPGPMPGMRPPMGGAGHMVSPPSGSGSMGILMPIYTIGIVVFFLYTMMKIMLKKPEEESREPRIKDFHMDPEQRKFLFAEEYCTGVAGLVPEMSVKDYALMQEQSKLLMKAEQQQQSRSRSKTPPQVFANKEDLESIPEHVCCHASNDQEPVEEQVQHQENVNQVASEEEEVDQLRRRLEETERAMERICRQMGDVADKLSPSIVAELLTPHLDKEEAEESIPAAISTEKVDGKPESDQVLAQVEESVERASAVTDEGVKETKESLVEESSIQCSEAELSSPAVEETVVSSSEEQLEKSVENLEEKISVQLTQDLEEDLCSQIQVCPSIEKTEKEVSAVDSEKQVEESVVQSSSTELVEETPSPVKTESVVEPEEITIAKVEEEAIQSTGVESNESNEASDVELQNTIKESIASVTEVEPIQVESEKENLPVAELAEEVKSPVAEAEPAKEISEKENLPEPEVVQSSVAELEKKEVSPVTEAEPIQEVSQNESLPEADEPAAQSSVAELAEEVPSSAAEPEPVQEVSEKESLPEVEEPDVLSSVTELAVEVLSSVAELALEVLSSVAEPEPVQEVSERENLPEVEEPVAESSVAELAEEAPSTAAEPEPVQEVSEKENLPEAEEPVAQSSVAESAEEVPSSAAEPQPVQEVSEKENLPEAEEPAAQPLVAELAEEVPSSVTQSELVQEVSEKENLPEAEEPVVLSSVTELALEVLSSVAESVLEVLSSVAEAESVQEVSEKENLPEAEEPVAESSVAELAEEVTSPVTEAEPIQDVSQKENLPEAGEPIAESSVAELAEEVTSSVTEQESIVQSLTELEKPSPVEEKQSERTPSVIDESKEEIIAQSVAELEEEVSFSVNGESTVEPYMIKLERESAATESISQPSVEKILEEIRAEPVLEATTQMASIVETKEEPAIQLSSENVEEESTENTQAVSEVKSAEVEPPAEEVNIQQTTDDAVEEIPIQKESIVLSKVADLEEEELSTPVQESSLDDICRRVEECIIETSVYLDGNVPPQLEEESIKSSTVEPEEKVPSESAQEISTEELKVTALVEDAVVQKSEQDKSEDGVAKEELESKVVEAITHPEAEPICVEQTTKQDEETSIQRRQGSEERKLRVMGFDATAAMEDFTKMPPELLPKVESKTPIRAEFHVDPEQVTSVFLDTTIPPESHLVVSEAECSAEAVPAEDLDLDAAEYESSPVVLSGKMVLSVIGMDPPESSEPVEATPRVTFPPEPFDKQIFLIPTEPDEEEVLDDNNEQQGPFQPEEEDELDSSSVTYRPPTPPLQHSEQETSSEFLTYDELEEVGEVENTDDVKNEENQSAETIPTESQQVKANSVSTEETIKEDIPLQKESVILETSLQKDSSMEQDSLEQPSASEPASEITLLTDIEYQILRSDTSSLDMNEDLEEEFERNREVAEMEHSLEQVDEEEEEPSISGFTIREDFPEDDLQLQKPLSDEEIQRARHEIEEIKKLLADVSSGVIHHQASDQLQSSARSIITELAHAMAEEGAASKGSSPDMEEYEVIPQAAAPKDQPDDSKTS